MKNLNFKWIATLFAFTAISCYQQKQEDAFFNDQLVAAADSRVAAYAIPNIVCTPSGTVLCFATARIGDNHDWGNIQEVVMIRSLDNGTSWEKPRTIAHIDNWTVRQTSAIVDPDNGKIMVFGYKSPRNTSEGERISETWKIAHPEEIENLGAGHFYLESFNEGENWSEITDIDLPYAPHDPGIVLKYGEFKGRYILPARTVVGTEFDWNNLYNGVLISDDKGLTWQAGGLTQSHVGEACVVELSDGRVYVSNRNHADNFGIRNHAISSDGGTTFTEFGDDPKLIEPLCDAGMVRYSGPKNGNAILFCNPNVRASKRWDSAARRNMSVKASFDDCKTWPLSKLVYEGPSAYSGITVGKKGRIFLVYERAGLGMKDSRRDLAIAGFNMAWIEQEQIPPPTIQGENLVFFGHQEIHINSQNQTDIYFTKDGTSPDINSPVYKNPFMLDKSATIKAIAISGEIYSIVSVTKFVKAKHKTPQYNFAFSKNYPASGDLALVDGIRGSLNYHDGCWQGFEGNDFEVILEWPKQKATPEISIRFLQSADDWIFFPEYVSFLNSSDGIDFQEIQTIENTWPQNSKEASIQSFNAKVDFKTGGYVKVVAKNIGTCPNWHKGAGGKSWLFVDEIDLD